jgi:Coenzyme PQQ synthesis protein D (PqqD)
MPDQSQQKNPQPAPAPAAVDSGIDIGPEQVWTRKADVVWSTVDGEAVLLDLSSGYYFSLNKVGAVIWEMLTGDDGLQSIHDAICARFRVDAAVAWEDIAALVRRLAGEKLVTLQPD